MLTNTLQTYTIPKNLYNEDNKVRHVGIEIEMSGIGLDSICKIILTHFCGTLSQVSPYEMYVKNSSIGEIKVELDFQYIKKLYELKLKKPFDIVPFEDFVKSSTKVLAFIAKNIVPVELVLPPLEMNNLACLDPVVHSLWAQGAKGTGESVFFAFGVHLNPELPSLTPETIVQYLRAFICLEPLIKQKESVNITRKISPFINEYPDQYKLLVLHKDYAPTMEQLIDDYLAFNPTRNRSLDMLPLFIYLDESRVRNCIKDDLINKRPTLHYRLPNSEIDDPEWGLWKCWNHYMLIETLVNDVEKLNFFCKKYLQMNQSFFHSLWKPWPKRVKSWLKE